MTDAYRAFFGLKKEPFPVGIRLDDIYQTTDLGPVVERFDYAVRLGAVALLTGEIGSGKSTALRYAAAKLHPSEYRIIRLHPRILPSPARRTGHPIHKPLQSLFRPRHPTRNPRSGPGQKDQTRPHRRRGLPHETRRLCRTAQPDPIRRRLQTLPPHGPGRTEQPHRSTQVSRFHASRLPDRGPKPSTGCRPIRNGTIPATPS